MYLITEAGQQQQPRKCATATEAVKPVLWLLTDQVCYQISNNLIQMITIDSHTLRTLRCYCSNASRL